MTGNSILKDGILLVEKYGIDLDKLNQEDRIGLMRTSEVTHKQVCLHIKIIYSLPYYRVI